MSVTEQEPTRDLDLRRFLQVLWTNGWVVLLSTVMVVVPAAVWANAKTPMYRATAEMVLEEKRSEVLFTPSEQQGEPTRAIATEAKRIRSRAVREAASEKLGYQADVETAASGFDNVIEVTAESTDPERAAATANTFVTTYIALRRATAIADILDAQTEIQRKIDEKQRAIDAINAEVAAAPPSQQQALAQARAFDRASLENQQKLFRDSVDQLQVNASLNSGGAEMLTPADPPADPFEPKVARTAALALVAGVMLGAALAFVREFLDSRIKNERDLELAAPGLPVLGTVPSVRGWRKVHRAQLVSISDPSSVATEAYRTLRASVQFLGVDRPVRVIQITSPSASEGKTTTTANLAVALARAGNRVVVMCCDLRRPRLHAFFGMSNHVGLTSVLVRDASLTEALQRIHGEDLDLRLLASGPIPPNPSELLSGERFAEVLALLRAQTDIVLIDSPPALAVSDANVLASRVDSVMLVVRPGRTTRENLRRTLVALRLVKAPVDGLVQNGVAERESYAYDYHREVDQPSDQGAAGSDADDQALEPMLLNGGSSPERARDERRRI